ncbi:hypothetical protein C5167_040270 [Papaver somniferum]|uniref:Uncharacterized protein n=1 Tax=Papaver somniferum TaxID=3469 RepID=A0A4Y7IEM8_PAPSO|nr:hypothetical protein C5167_040270 [Papaver somniferum]
MDSLSSYASVLIRRSTSIVLLAMLFMLIYGVVKIRENSTSSDHAGNSSYVHGEVTSSTGHTHAYLTQKLIMVVSNGHKYDSTVTGRARRLRVLNRNRFPPPQPNHCYITFLRFLLLLLLLLL